VLKGPQGTLFGRNATGGVIQILTRDPSFAPSADIHLGYGKYGTSSGSLYGTTGIKIASRAHLGIQIGFA
jgi:iron complex outermembrane receptor protein